jgi:hypothetical protein
MDAVIAVETFERRGTDRGCSFQRIDSRFFVASHRRDWYR